MSEFNIVNEWMSEWINQVGIELQGQLKTATKMHQNLVTEVPSGDIETRWQKWKAQSINQNSKMAEKTTNQRGSSKASQSINQKVLCSDTSNRWVAFWISYQYQYCGYHSNQWSAIQWSMTKSPIAPRCPLKGANNKHCQRHNGPRNWLRDLD